ncbi:MAG: 2,3-bisphosphoglycerate-independent phosphoglycerate mutase [Candidatus Woesearchaeota archaeon]
MENTLKAIMVILDGLGDYIHPVYGKTPLMAAKRLTLKKREKESETGLMQPIFPGLPVGSDTGHLALFGYDPFKYYAGRGAYEALGAGFELQEKDVAFRLNFATLKDGKIIDRRAGRSDYGLKEIVKELNFETKDAQFIVLHTTEHRGVLIIRPKRNINLGKDVEDFDSEILHLPKRLNDDDSNKWTEVLLEEFITRSIKLLKDHRMNKERESKKLLPANIVLLRGAGKLPRYKKISEMFGIKMVCVAGGALYKGVAKSVGIDVVNVEGATGDKNTNLGMKITTAIKLKESYDVVFLHIKATDNFGHDGDFEGKKNFIEKVDKYLKYLFDAFDIVLITADHSTPVTVKRHTGDPVPIMLWSKPELGITRPDNGTFDELSQGLLRVTALDVLRLIRNKLNRVQKFGE